MISVISNTACTLFGVRNEETPKYTTIKKNGTYEIRYYEPYIVAKTKVSGNYKDAQGKAFRILAGYIFGNNVSSEKISMTAPVKQSESQTISMTAPVMQVKDGNEWEMTFMMPSKYNLNSLPIPNDKRVVLEKIDGKYMGVVTYSWYDSLEKNEKMAKSLSEWLMENKDFQIISGPIFAGYNPPWTIPFLRKNEIMFELHKK